MSRDGAGGEPLREKHRLLQRTAEDAYAAGRVDVALGAYRKVLEYARELADPTEIEDATTWVGTCLFNLGRAEESLAVMGEEIGRLEDPVAGEIALDARCTALKYWLWLSVNFRGKRAYLLDLLARARRILADRGLAGMEDSFLYFEAMIARYRGEFAEASALADRALGVARERQTIARFVSCEYLRAAARLRLDAGIHDGSAEALGREMLTSDPAAPFIGPIRGHQILSRVALLAGNPDRALDHALQADHASLRTAHPASQAESKVALARAWLGTGEVERATAAVAEADRLADGYHSELLQLDVRMAGLEVQRARDEDAEFAAAGRRALAAAAKIDPRLETTFNGDRVRRFLADPAAWSL